MTRIDIGLAPPGLRSAHGWLFDHLERVYPVRFVPREAGAVLPGDHAVVLTDAAGGGAPRRGLTYVAGPDGAPAGQVITFTNSGALDERLRGRALEERSLPLLTPLADSAGEPLAICNGGPVWIRRRTPEGTVDIVRLPGPLRLRERMLWDNLQEHRFFFLMTLVHYLYGILAASGWIPPPLRAAFVVDDPNFRTATYGHLRFREVSRFARTERFHVSIATPPIDLAATSGRMASFLAAHADVLSISIHGNDHVHHELLLPQTEEAAFPVLCRMLRRVEEFEHRHRIPVSRVVVPPNELCSPATLRALRRFPIAAVCASRPRPWLPGDTWADSAGPQDALLCWQAGDTADEGMTIIRRSTIPNNMVFRAFLNQPVIRYFHHDEFRNGVELPRRAADEINSLGGVRWMSLGEMAATNYEARVQGGTMTVRPFSRQVSVAVPDPVTHLRVESSQIDDSETVVTVGGTPLAAGRQDGGIPVAPGTMVEVRLLHAAPQAVGACRGSRTTARAWAHRRISEAVDRLRLPR